MILKHLHLEYFKQYGQLDVSFREGLVGIVGRNGAGKSSLFEAVLLCLFGRTTSDKEFYKTSWAPAKSPTILELTFELGLTSYRVRREFRGKAMQHHAFLYNARDELQASGATPVGEAIAQLVGLDKDAFTRSVFSGQKELGILSNTKGEERKRMVRRMVGLDKLDKIQQLLREDRNSKKREIQGQQALLWSKEEQKALKDQIKEQKGSIQKSQQNTDRLQKDYQAKNAEYLDWKKSFDLLNQRYKQFNELQKELVKWEKALESLQNRQKELTKELAQLQEAQKEHKRLQPIAHSYREQKTRWAALEKNRLAHERSKQIDIQRQSLAEQVQEKQQQIDASEKLLTDGKQLAKTIQEAEAKLSQQQQQLQQAEAQAATLQQQIGGVRARIQERQQQLQQIESLGKDAHCPTCLQPLIHSYDQTLQRLQSDIQAYEQKELNKWQAEEADSKKTIGQQQQQLKDQQQQLSEHKSQREVLREQYRRSQQLVQEVAQLKQKDEALDKEWKDLQSLPFDPAEFRQLSESIAKLEGDFLQFTKLDKQVERLADVQVHLQANKERMATGEAGIVEKTKALEELSFSLPQFEQTKARMDQLEDNKELAREAVRQEQEQLSRLQQQLTGLRRDMAHQERIREEIGANQEAFQELELLDGLFSNFKNKMLIRIRPMIKETAGGLFEQITKGRYEGIEVDDNFEFHIFENGTAYPIQRFSGGEIDLANLCLRIGISKAIAELSGSQVAMNFLAFDEIFGSQDDERRFEILLALDLLKEQYRQIYIISHIDTIKEHFPNILQIQRSSDGSRAEWQ